MHPDTVMTAGRSQAVWLGLQIARWQVGRTFRNTLYGGQSVDHTHDSVHVHKPGLTVSK